MAEPLATITVPVIRSAVVRDDVPGPESAPSADMLPTLEAYEDLLRKTGNDGWDAAAAISDIIDRRLYLVVGYERFSDYCAERLKIGRQWAYRLRQAYKFREELASLPAEAETPENEDRVVSRRHEASDALVSAMSPRATSILANLPQGQAADVLAALSVASDGESPQAPTLQAVQSAVRQVQSEAKPEAAPPEPAAPPKPAKSESRQAAEAAIANGEAGREILKTIRKAMKDLRALKPLPGLEILTDRRESIVRFLESAANATVCYLPETVCKKCDGKGCSDCGNHGWLNKANKRAVAAASR